MRQRISKLAALVDRTGNVRTRMTGNSAWRRELPKQNPQPFTVLRDFRIDLGVGAFQVCLRDDRGTAMPGTRDIKHVGVVFLDQAIEMHPDQILSRRSSP